MQSRRTREEFLNKLWMPYPELKGTVYNIADFLQSPEQVAHGGGWIAGRLLAGQLCSEGQSYQLKLSSQARWPYDLAFDSALLHDGDLLAVHLVKTDGKAADEWLIDQVILLTPAKGEAYTLDFTLEQSARWMSFLNAVRGFFTGQKFIEALTPTLVPSPGTEPFLDPFLTVWEMGTKDRQTFYLPTSPEFHLKKMLAAGWTRIFEIKSCFRNGEIGAHHQPEFQMLEWYRAYANVRDIEKDIGALLGHLSQSLRQAIPPVERLSVAELFKNKLSFVLNPQSEAAELRDLCRQLKIAFSEDDSFDDLFFRVFLEKIEPDLGLDAPLVVYNYPPSQAALSRLTAEGWADRFELYWKGLELANAFHELNDPNENQLRFTQDREKKKSLDKPLVPVDDELLRALHWGLPPSGGIALGLDRLFMAIYNQPSIAKGRAFPFRATRL